ncbi:polyketide synthase [Micromonospora sp. M12]
MEIAVIGASCRLPQAADPDSLWRLLSAGRSAVGRTPADRWTETTQGVGFGGFLDRVGHFDPAFFGISAREAAAMDPQQRLALELGWEALEDAGLVPTRLAGHTGVFLGATGIDYALLLDRQGRAGITSHSFTGQQRAMIANRISYALGLRGPSMVVDTGQSSSLVAVHLACESLRRGESAVAVAGGVSLNLTVENALIVARTGALSPDGSSRAFDADANGFVRAEGGAMVVLKPLAAALADGDVVSAVIRGSAMNNDGGGAGLTVPEARAQRRSSDSPVPAPTSTRRSCATSSCTAPAPAAAIRSRRSRWARSRPTGRPGRRCWSARSRRTSATWRPQPGSRACSRWCSRCGTASCHRASTSRPSERTCRWPS